MKSFLVGLLCLFSLVLSHGQQQITSFAPNLAPVGSSPSLFYRYGNQILFMASTGKYGRELHITNGTAIGTTLVKDVNIGAEGINPFNLITYKGLVYFIVDDGTNGQQLWVTDGKSLGTKQISTNIYKGVTSEIVTDGKHIYFLRKENEYILELWRSDGTPEGTKLVKGDIPIWNTPNNLTFAGGLLYFSCQPYESNNTRVWRSDGTEAGTYPVTQELDGSGSAQGGTSHPTQFVEFNGNLYFIARSSNLFSYPVSVGLMKSEGSVANTKPIKALHEGNSRLINHGDVIVHKNKMYFSFFEVNYNRFFIWESDGTATNTRLIFDKSYSDYFSPTYLFGKDDYLYFTVGNSNSGTSLARLNVVTQSVEVIKEIDDKKSSPFIFFSDWSANSIIGTEGANFFIKSKYDDWDLPELWTSDGTTSGTIKLSATSNVGDWCSLGSSIYFDGATNQTSYELWSSAGSIATTSVLKAINTDPYGLGYSPLTANSNTVVFRADDGTTGSEPWATDGTLQGLVQLIDANPGKLSSLSYPSYFSTWQNDILFTAITGSGQTQLFQTNGTVAGTNALSKLAYSEYPIRLTKSRDDAIIFFVTRLPDGTNSLYSIDKNKNITFLKNFGNNSYGVGFTVQAMTVTGSTTYLLLNGEGIRLWKSGGTPSGTTMVTVLPNSFAYNESISVVETNGTFYFTLSNFSSEQILYKSDGTAAGTVIMSSTEGEFSQPANLTSFGSKLVFTALSSTSGNEIWITDGTANGTKLLKDIFPGQQSGVQLPRFTTLGANIYFTANDGVHGPELWKSDGSTGNTIMVKDILPGSEGSKPDGYKLIDDKLYFSAFTPDYGNEMWATDGTTENTKLVLDVLPGPEYSNPANFVKLNNFILFEASTGDDGVQLWSYDPTVTGLEDHYQPLAVYPNPSNGVFKIRFDEQMQHKGTIEVFAMEGKSILKKNYDGEETIIDLTGNAPGLYIVKIIDAEKSFTKKVIKF